MKRARLHERVWWSLHEPRSVTVIAVIVYSTAILSGIEMIGQFGLPAMVDPPLVYVEGAVLIAAGLIGAPSSWVGKWYIERAACLALTGTGVLLLAGALVAETFFEPPHDITTSWVMGMVCWVALGLTRWVRVRHQPYAPGRGPLPIAAKERIIMNEFLESEEALNRAREEG
ncbi:MAG: hypothetical protein ACOYD1_07805 [Candidatus Nanopelagicales bacterium]